MVEGLSLGPGREDREQEGKKEYRNKKESNETLTIQ